MGSFFKFKYPGIAVLFMVILGFNIGFLKLIPVFNDFHTESVMGGNLYNEDYSGIEDHDIQYKRPEDEYIERFLRPSAAKALDKEFEYKGEGEIVPSPYSTPGKVVKAYFDVLSDAANMGDKKGGCGSIGQGMNPYPAAYSLLSQEKKDALHYEEFLESFEGIGHINLIKLVETRTVENQGKITPVFFVEIETIEGSDVSGKTYFAYYYGHVSAVQEEGRWKIDHMELTPQDFLCHAYHGWWHDARTVVEVNYITKQGLMEKILNTEQQGDFTHVMARGTDGKDYRFTFVRLTNGADVELWQSVMEDGKWKPVTLNAQKNL